MDFDKTIKYLNEINNKTGLKCGVTNKILDLSSGKNIIAVVTELNKIVPVISIKNNDNKLKVSNLHYYTDSNVAIKDDIIMLATDGIDVLSPKQIAKLIKGNFWNFKKNPAIQIKDGIETLNLKNNDNATICVVRVQWH